MKKINVFIVFILCIILSSCSLFDSSGKKIKLNETTKLSNIEITVNGVKALKDRIDAKTIFKGEEKVYSYDYDTDKFICLEIEMELKSLRDDHVFLDKDKIDKHNMCIYLAYDNDFKNVYFQTTSELGMDNFTSISRKGLEESNIKGYMYFIIPKEIYESDKNLVLAFETQDGRVELGLK